MWYCVERTMTKLFLLNVCLLVTLSLIAGEVAEKTSVERAREEIGKLDKNIEAKKQEIERDRASRDEFKEQKDNEELRQMLESKIAQTKIIITEGSAQEKANATKEQQTARQEQQQVQERIAKMQDSIIARGKNIDVRTPEQQRELSMGSRLAKQLTIWKNQVQARLYDFIGKPEKARALRDHIKTLRDELFKPRPNGAWADAVSGMIHIDRNIDTLSNYLRFLLESDRQVAKNVTQENIAQATEVARKKIFERENLQQVAEDILEESFVLRDQLDSLENLSAQDKVTLKRMDDALREIMGMLDIQTGKAYPRSPAEKAEVQKKQRSFVDEFLKSHSDQVIAALVDKLAGTEENPGMLAKDPIRSSKTPEYKQLSNLIRDLELLDISLLEPHQASLVAAITRNVYKGMLDALQMYYKNNEAHLMTSVAPQDRASIMERRAEMMRSHARAERRLRKSLEREQSTPEYKEAVASAAYKAVVAENKNARIVPQATLDSSVHNIQVSQDTLIKSLDTVNKPESAKTAEQTAGQLAAQTEKLAQQIVAADPSQGSLHAVEQAVEGYDRLFATAESVAHEPVLSNHAVTVVAQTMALAQEALPVLQEVADQLTNNLVQVIEGTVVQLPQITKEHAERMSNQAEIPKSPESQGLLTQLKAGKKGLKSVTASDIQVKKPEDLSLSAILQKAIVARRPSLEQEEEEPSSDTEFED